MKRDNLIKSLLRKDVGFVCLMSHRLLVLLILLVVAGISSQFFVFSAIAQEHFEETDDLILEEEVPLDQDYRNFVASDVIKPDESLRSIPDESKRLDEDQAPLSLETKQAISELQMIQINRSLRKVIEENERLLRQNKNLDVQLTNLRGQKEIESSRITRLVVERDAYKQKIEKLQDVQQEYEEGIEELRDALTKREKVLTENARLIDSLQKQVAAFKSSGDGSMMAAVKLEDPLDKPGLVAKVKEIQRESFRLKVDEAKIRYNMGNIYFRKGLYQRAKNEYQKALELMPENSSAHFNLAFVSSDYMHDARTALKHYQQYLILNPSADDRKLVQEKILEMQLQLRTMTNSVLEKDIHADYDKYNLR